MHPLFANVRRPILLIALLAPSVRAQWYSFPKNPAQSVYAGNWFVAHDTGAGVVAFSAIAQTWTNVSPAGSSIVRLGDSFVATSESPTLVRGWSAFSNSSATQAVSNSVNWQSDGAPYGVLLDNAPATNGVLRGYSAYTNTWASLPLSQAPTFSIVSSTNVAVQRDGLDYHAYSAYTGQWSTFTVAVAGGNAFVGTDYAAVDLHGTSGPRQYAAFSALRGTWTLSPTYPTAGAGPISSPNATAFAIKVDTGSATSFRYAGYSPLTGQWNTSALVHTTSSTQSSIAFKNIVRIQDTDTNARFEVFGAGNGIWQALTGANLTEDSLHEDFQIVRNSSLSSTIVYAASALVGGGYASVTVPTFFPGISQGSHSCLIVDGTSARAYTAATNTFLPAVPQPSASGVSQGAGGTVAGFNVQGSSAFGTTAQAFSARWGNWVAGPSIGPSESWTTLAAGATLVTYRLLFPGYVFHVFDEHRNAWNAPITVAPPSFSVGVNTLVYTDGAGTYTAYSAQRGAWSSQSGIGTITSPGGLSNSLENLLWFTDSNNLIWVFATPDRTQSWFQWPLGSQFATSGPTPGGSTPYFGVSVRGASPKFALLYAALALAPSPLSIPGIGGQLDLDPGGAIQLAGLGVFDADGVLDVRISIPGMAPPSTQLWMQAVTVDLFTVQIDILGRATGTRFY